MSDRAAGSPLPGAADNALAQLRALLDSGVITQAMFDAAAAASQARATGGDESTQVLANGAAAIGAGATALGAGAAQISGDLNGTLNLGVIIEQARQPGASADTLRRAYLARLLRDHNQLPLLAGEQGAERVQLSSVYTALLTQRTDNDRRGLAPHDAPNHPGREARALSALEVLDTESQLVLMAGPGGGKSTFVNVVAMSLAGELLGMPQPSLATLLKPLPTEEVDQEARRRAKQPELQPWHHGPLLPVLVTLRDLASQLPAPDMPVDADAVWNFIAGQLRRKALGEFAPHLYDYLLNAGGLVLFDGLDEVPDADKRRLQIKQAVQCFAATFRNCRLLVTSRTYAYQKQDWKLDGFAEVQLRPFSKAQMRAFIDAWYGHMAALERLTATDAKDRADTLKTSIERSPRLRGLAERPLLLTLIAQLQTKGGGALPQRREALYDAAVTMLLDTWEKLKPRTAADGTSYQEPSLSEFLQVGIDQIRRQLNRLAFEAHRDQPELKGSADIPQAHLIQALLTASPGNPDIKVARLQEYLRDRAGIVTEHAGGQVQFPHRSFQEYLAACHLTDDDFPDQLARLTRADPNRWREVALLAGAKAARGSESNAWLLAETLCHEPAPSPNGKGRLPQDAAWGARLAAQTLVESARLDDLVPRNANKRDRIRDWQVALICRRALPAVERAAAGRHLAALGDPRPEVMTLEGMQFVLVPSGRFWMGDDELPDASPCHITELTHAFAMARFPVTAAQWRAYCHLSGEISEGLGRDNEPVVNVDWYAAIRFCRWLTHAWSTVIPVGWEVMLPSEAEFERVARGGHQIASEVEHLALTQVVEAVDALPQLPTKLNPWARRRYPWGLAWQTERANVEGLVGEPSAVGTFFRGASPEGLEEVAGNVWEWTRSLWGRDFVKPSFKYPYDCDDARREDLFADRSVLRVVRGGSWGFSRLHACCAVRAWERPDSSDGYLGFRVVLRPSRASNSPARSQP